jgi:TM2 domain-containing membrane protein YozV
VRGVIYCEECLASHLSGTMPPPGTNVVPPGVQPPPTSSSPKLAALLGMIPGVGAFYNGEYAKGFIHVLIFATLIWLTDHTNGLFGIAIAAFYLYMPIEAYQTAKARELGVPAPDPFGFNNLFGAAPVAPRPNVVNPASAANPGSGFVPNEPAPVVDGSPVPPPVPGYVAMPEEPATSNRVPAGAFILIGLGVLFLLDEVGFFHFDWVWRFWPIILIAVGIRVLMKRRGMGW